MKFFCVLALLGIVLGIKNPTNPYTLLLLLSSHHYPGREGEGRGTVGQRGSWLLTVSFSILLPFLLSFFLSFSLFLFLLCSLTYLEIIYMHVKSSSTGIIQRYWEPLICFTENPGLRIHQGFVGGFVSIFDTKIVRMLVTSVHPSIHPYAYVCLEKKGREKRNPKLLGWMWNHY